MWIIFLFVYVAATLPNNAQEFTSFEAQTATETYANSDVNRDSTRPPVTLTIRNGRTENVDRTITQNSGPLYYSREWQRVLMPIGFNSDRDGEKYVNENERSSNHQFQPTFIQHPDVEANNTEANQYSLIEERNQFPGVPVFYQHPFIYFQSNSNSTSDFLTTNVDETYADTFPIENTPRNAGNFQAIDFYRNTQNIESPVVPFQSASPPSSNVGNIETNTEKKQIPSSVDTLPIENVLRNIESFQSFDSYRNSQNTAPVAIPYQSAYQSSLSSNVENIEINREQQEIPSSAISKLTSSDPTRINEELIKPLSTDNSNLIKEIPNFANFYANSQRYFPPMIPAYFPPYPFVPLQRGNAFHPMLPHPLNDPNFDRESGSEVKDERIQVPQNEVLSGDVADHTIENVPSETAANIFPPQPLPSVVPGYSFGPYLSPFPSPLLPNIPPSGIPLRPLPPPLPRSVQRGDAIPDVPLPPPVVAVNPITDVIPEVIPQAGSLIPEEQPSLNKGAEIISGEPFPEEDLDSVKIPYEFGYDMSDGKGNDQHRNEVSDISGVVSGSYGYKNTETGLYRIVFYTAGAGGFQANIYSNEPGVASSSSANVVVVAENPPPNAITEGKNKAVSIITGGSDSNAELIAAGSIQEIK